VESRSSGILGRAVLTYRDFASLTETAVRKVLKPPGKPTWSHKRLAQDQLSTLIVSGFNTADDNSCAPDTSCNLKPTS
jgi:hypothetical protein